MIHHLVEKDTEARKGRCSVCGPVGIRRSGTGFVCATKAQEYHRAYYRRNPGRNRTQASNPHQLVARNAATRTGTCPICGPVTIVPWARGWICPTRAKELGRVVEQAAPQQHCRDCMVADGVLVWLQADGCPRCAETDLNAELAKLAADERLMAELQDWSEDGLHVIGWTDPYEMPEYESAVPGWKTIG